MKIKPIPRIFEPGDNGFYLKFTENGLEKVAPKPIKEGLTMNIEELKNWCPRCSNVREWTKDGTGSTCKTCGLVIGTPEKKTYKMRYDCRNCMNWSLLEIPWGAVAPTKTDTPCPKCGVRMLEIKNRERL